jgi:hypothetical protein
MRGLHKRIAFGIDPLLQQAINELVEWYQVDEVKAIQYAIEDTAREIKAQKDRYMIIDPNAVTHIKPQREAEPLFNAWEFDQEEQEIIDKAADMIEQGESEEAVNDYIDQAFAELNERIDSNQ